MTPRQHKEFEEKERIRLETLSHEWHYPITKGEDDFGTVIDQMQDWRLSQGEVPLIIRLIENPRYDIGLFAGYVDLFTHDSIHVILGRGILPKDEAFVIGYTMGSTKKMKRWRRNLFMWCAKHLYPKEYRLGEEERFIFNMGVMAGSLCQTDLSTVDFSDRLADGTVKALRETLKIDTTLLRHCYSFERACFPDSKESSRLLKFS